MCTLFLAIVTSATVFATGMTEVAASDYRYCIQGGEDFGGGAGDCSFASYQQCQATASGRMGYGQPLSRGGQSLSRERRRPDNSCQAASSLTPRASRANQMAWSAVHLP
jgi:Protein of unknown function (DUF3551)